MRVLVAHHAYRSTAPSGENAAVHRDVALLREAGHDVRELGRSSDGMGPRALAAAGMGVRAPGAAAELRRVLADGWRPDILHAHNVFPLLTTSPLRAARDAGIPVVTTLHNYRRSCAAGTHFRAGSICEDCTGRRLAWPALVHGCYRDSRAQTVPVVLNQALDRSLWNEVDAVVALTPYLRQRAVEAGATGAVVVRPTSVPDPGEPSEPGSGALFVGRLSVEKGATLLIEAWAAAAPAGATLTVVGDGPDRDRVAAAAARTPGVRFLGRLDPGVVADQIRRCAVLVAPSLWYEGFPTVVAEAFSHGRPVISCDNPNMRTVVGDCGWLAPADAAGFGRTVAEALGSPAEVRRRAAAARRRYLREMTPEASYELLVDAYGAARSRRPGPAVATAGRIRP